MDGRNDHISFLKGIREWHRLRISSAVCNLIASRLRLIRLSALCPYAHADGGRAKWLVREKAGAEQHEESRTPAKSRGNHSENSCESRGLASESISFDPLFQDALSFGRPGYGAPVRTKSGRIRTQIIGNTDIRFQENKSVRKTIDNNIRYQGDPEMKAMYHRELGEYLRSAIAGVLCSMRWLHFISEEQIKERREKERSEREIDRSMAKDMVRMNVD